MRQVSGILWMIVYTLALFALKKLELDRLPATIIAIAPIIPFVVFLYQFVHHLRNADELERRVQLEALAIAFPTTLVGLMLLGLLPLAVPLSEHDWSYRHIWGFLPQRSPKRPPRAPHRRRLEPGRTGQTGRRLPPDHQRHRDGQIRAEPVAGAAFGEIVRVWGGGVVLVVTA